MSDALPEPLTPAGCDLRGLEWMPLYGDRLLTSETWLMAGPEGRCAALALWWASWKQCPAGSLPDQDRALAQLAGYGLAVAAWQAVREEALRGFVLCADGRLYHPIVAALALDAWARRIKERERKATWRGRKDAAGDCPADVPRDTTGTERGHDGDMTGTERGRDADATRTETGTTAFRDADVPADRTGQDRTGKEEERKEDSAPLRVAEPEPAPSVPAVRELVVVPETTLNPRRSRIKADWQPNQRDRDFAAERGVDASAEAQGFRDHHAAKGSLMVDWSAAWRTWIGNAVKFRARGGSGARPGKTDWLHRQNGLGTIIDGEAA